MLFTILGLVFIAVGTYHTYKSARDNGRKAGLWALAAFAVGFGIQFVVPFLFGVIVAVVMTVRGRRLSEIQEAIQTPATIIGFVCLAASIAGVWLVLRKASELPDDEPLVVPPPPDFNAGA